MQNDKTTLKDLSIFTSDGSEGVFALLDYATTQEGKNMLRRHIYHPPDTLEKLKEVQEAIKFWSTHPDLWPKIISNGTLVMLDKFFESADSVSAPPSGITLVLNSFLQKVINKQEYFITKFSLSHLADFLTGCMQLADIIEQETVPPLLERELTAIKDELKHGLTKEIIGVTKDTKYTTLANLNYRARREMKNMVYRLINSYARMDAWQSMARATVDHRWVFPELLPASPVCFETTGLSHPLLRKPVSYDISFDNNRNFLLLTGANMSGKTTFMRALGVSALMAHLGMGVPAKSLRISFMQGIITNMQVEDNILKGESYFFAEVQRMKQTATKLKQQAPHLVLMDELFKGTNVHDAFECTRAVLEGLLHHPNHLMILSTHLYEVAQQFSSNKGILFFYFVTNMADSGGYEFTYELKTGISNDRIGYRILQKEGVIDLLQQKDQA
ncbi:MAG: mismatch repair protein MutS [Flavipsychrobacter sp.]|jgi:DNA mismatch repair ATPase MutS|nr:mismatch repair protein MutS [Flavipsychrobacter sp.]